MTVSEVLPEGVQLVEVEGRNVILAFTQPTPASQRGTLLMDAEDALCKAFGPMTVWHEPLGDRNSLRNLRGIEVKA